MAYSDSIGDNAQLLRRTVAGVTDFSGRSRRTEVIYYWIATALVGVVFNIAVVSLPYQASLIVGRAVQFLFLIPMFALFVRRLHDQNRSGWWSALLPLSLLLSIPQMVTEFRGGVQATVAEKTSPVDIVAALCALAIFVLCLLPGTDGANRFGADPRLEDA